MSDVSVPPRGLVLGNKLYDRLKFLVQIVLPALVVLYSTTAELWDIPGTLKVTGTIAAVNAALGVILGVSSSSFKSTQVDSDPVGDFEIVTDPEGNKTYQLRLDKEPADMSDSTKIVFNRVDNTL